MNHTILQTLFLDNLELPAEAANFCHTIPEYVQAEQEYNRASAELMDLIGYERYARFEEALNHYMFCEVRASYLFGLGLRREVLEGVRM